MSARRILILYGTSYGQTARIAGRLAELLTIAGNAVTLVDGDEARDDLSLAGFDGVMVGGSLVIGQHQRCVRRFVRAHVAALNAMPCAFFSVSASAASPSPRGRADALRCLERLLHETGFRPAISETVAGAIAYTRYGWITRWIMRRIAAKEGGPTDSSRDHELTDWAQVERLAQRFDALVSRTPASTLASV